MTENFIPKIWAEKIFAHVLVDKSIIGGLADDRTPEQREADAAFYKQRREEARDAWSNAQEVLAGWRDPIVQAVLELHADDGHGCCAGCDFEANWEGEAARLPCRTWHAVAGALGVAMPDPEVWL